MLDIRAKFAKGREFPKRVIKGSLQLGSAGPAKPFTLNSVQRLFSTFPSGGPGIGLLLLRISVAATSLFIVASSSDLSSIHSLFAGALLIALSLTIGFLTPYLSFVACVSALVNLFRWSSRPDELILASLTLNALALALIGPGAYSLDARLFGRRVVVLPPRRDSGLI